MIGSTFKVLSCYRYPDNETLDHMTTKKQMRQNMKQLLEDLVGFVYSSGIPLDWVL